MTSFPKGWFFIKNLNNGYVLSTEKFTAGEPIVIATLKTKDFDTQLWQYGEDGRLHNKKTGFVLDIFKGECLNKLLCLPLNVTHHHVSPVKLCRPNQSWIRNCPTEWLQFFWGSNIWRLIRWPYLPEKGHQLGAWYQGVLLYSSRGPACSSPSPGQEHQGPQGTALGLSFAFSKALLCHQ